MIVAVVALTIALSCERHAEIHWAIATAIARGADPDAVLLAVPDVVVASLRDGERVTADEVLRIQAAAVRAQMLGGKPRNIDRAALFSCGAVVA